MRSPWVWTSVLIWPAGQVAGWPRALRSKEVPDVTP